MSSVLHVAHFTRLPARFPCRITTTLQPESTDNKWSHNFDEKPHRRLVTPRGDEWIRPTLTPIKYMLRWTHKSKQSKWHLDRFSRFCVHNGADNPKNCLFPLGSGFHLIYGSLDPPDSALERYPDRFSRFFCTAHERAQQTDQRRYCMCSNRPLSLAISAMWPKK